MLVYTVERYKLHHSGARPTEEHIVQLLAVWTHDKYSPSEQGEIFFWAGMLKVYEYNRISGTAPIKGIDSCTGSTNECLPHGSFQRAIA
jgi:hypothetical protein